jgi:hypothetical protein
VSHQSPAVFSYFDELKQALTFNIFGFACWQCRLEDSIVLCPKYMWGKGNLKTHHLFFLKLSRKSIFFCSCLLETSYTCCCDVHRFFVRVRN